MRTFALTTLAAGVLGLAALPSVTVAANASPVATPLPLASADQPEVTLVSGGCGPFRHRGFNGFCYPGGGFGGGYGYRRFGYGSRRFGYRGYGYRRF